MQLQGGLLGFFSWEVLLHIRFTNDQIIVDDIKLGGVADIPQNYATVERDLDKLENCADRNLGCQQGDMQNPAPMTTPYTSISWGPPR